MEDFDDVPPTVAPNPADLLASLAAMLGDHDLRVIAEADHGSGFGHNLAALRVIARIGLFPCPLPWHPREVLERVSWDQPPPEPAEERRLWRHAFACCALLRAYGDPESRDVMFDQRPTLVGLAISLHNLATLPLPRRKREALAAMDRHAAALLAWLTPRVLDLNEPAFFGLALLWFSLVAAVPGPALAALIDWVMRAGEETDGWYRPIHGGVWLLGQPYGSLRAGSWRAIGALLPSRLKPEHGADVARGVRRISDLLTPRDAAADP